MQETSAENVPLREWVRRLVIVAFFFAGAVYLGWRCGTLNAEFPLFSRLLLVAEACGYVASSLYLLIVWDVADRRLTTTSPVRCGVKSRPVDVYVTTYNEPELIVRRTLLCAKRMEGRFRIWLLDDGARSSMRELAQQLDVGYLARATNEHAKAGNLNAALAQTDSELIAVFDADHAPCADFLEKTVPWFEDADVAFVQTAHDFHNLDSFQHARRGRDKFVWHEQSLFYRVIQRAKDRHNAAFFCGSSAVIRRSALEGVGGFAIETITEDLHTSIRMHRRGWKSVYLDEALAHGLTPETYGTYARQRRRWAIGNLQTWWHEKIVFGRGLTLSQRLCYLESIVSYVMVLPRLVLLLTPVVVLMTGALPFRALFGQFLVVFPPYFLLGIWAYVEASRGYGWYADAEILAMARLPVFLQACFQWVSRPAFGVTPKTRTASPADWPYVLPHVFLAAASIAALVVGALRCLVWHNLTWQPALISGIWAGLVAYLACAVIWRARRFHFMKRAEYRFPVRVPVAVRHGGTELTAITHDLSPSGMGLVLESDMNVAPGARVVGEIHLDSGSLPISAEVRHARQTQNGVIVGCTFEWASSTPPAALEIFLHGSRRQWTDNRIAAAVPTPVDRISGLLWRQRSAAVADAVASV